MSITPVYATRNWKGIIIHHSATDTGTVESIDRYHRSLGWNEIGYHYVIYRNGDVGRGRSLNKRGAHALTGKPYSRNGSHIGICLIGKTQFTEIQKKAVRFLCWALKQKYKNITSIERHHNLCPGKGIDVEDIEKEILEGRY